MSELVELTDDLSSHRINLVLGDMQFVVPLISHVTGNLWQGGCTPGVHLPDDFEFSVSLWTGGRYEIGPDTVRIEVEMQDSAVVPEVKVLLSIARMLNAFRLKGKTLLNCEGGLNRSGLVAGLALVLEGMAAEDAIALLRQRRSPMVLCNPNFEQWLLAYTP